MLDRRENGRQRILDGAARILDGGALGDFTVDSLARNLHMSKSTLYKYFESKDHVVVALVEGACRDTHRLLGALDLSKEPSASQALERLMAVLADHVDRLPAAVLLALRDLPPDAAANVEGVRDAARKSLEAVLSRGRQTGEFRVTNSALASRAYIAAVEEGVLAAARGVGGVTRGQALLAVHRMVADGVVASA